MCVEGPTVHFVLYFVSRKYEPIYLSTGYSASTHVSRDTTHDSRALADALPWFAGGEHSTRSSSGTGSGDADGDEGVQR